MHITSLPGRYGIGEIGRKARDFVDTMITMQLSVWQFLPLGPTAYGDSPYQSLSTFAGNEMLIDIEDLLENELLHASEVRALTELPSDYVDYGRLIPTKTALLHLAASRFHAKASAALLREFDRFIEQNDDYWLHDYALYRIIKLRHNEQPWPRWPAAFIHHNDTALKQIEDEHELQITEIKIMQFMFHIQWQRLRKYANEAGVQLFGDMPICIALDSADAWANPELLSIDRDGKPDAVAGVPPDYFSADGQLWGNPLYNWDFHKQTGYRWWIERLRASAKLADIVRIDHFRGFESYWSVAADAVNARQGSWEPGPGDAIFIAMKKALGTLPIVAEDLGVITPEVEALRDQHNIPGMVVLQLEFGKESFDLANVPEYSVCYTGTHDNDTTVGWFIGNDNDMRSKAERQKTRELVRKLINTDDSHVAMGMIKTAFSTKSRLAIAPMQDYLGLGSEARINTPGTSRNNWRWRIKKDQLSSQLCEQVAEMVRVTGRALNS